MQPSLLGVIVPLVTALVTGTRHPARLVHANAVRTRGSSILNNRDLAELPPTKQELPPTKQEPPPTKQELPFCDAELAPMQHPPPRSATLPGYVADRKLVTWAPFQYAQPSVRRQAAREFVRRNRTQLPPLRVVLLGGVAAGKGTIAPMLSQAFRVRCLGVGALLRGEIRAGRPRGLAASRRMAAGELLPDALVLEVLRERLAGDTDGWLLDGFPRTASQAEAIFGDGSWAELRPDAVIVIERPDELVREFALGRCSDSATGQTYHPVYAPPPAEVQERLVWRIDDTYDALSRRISDHRRSFEAIVAAVDAARVPLRRFDNARSELETFGEVASFLEGVAMDKLVAARAALEEPGGEARSRRAMTLAEVADALQPSPATPVDVSPYCSLDESEEECLARFQAEQAQSLAPDVDVYCDPDEPEAACVLRYQEEQQAGALLAAVQRCNALGDFTPLLVDDEQVGPLRCTRRNLSAVGWLSSTVVDALATQLAVGLACELVEGRAAASAAAEATPRPGGVAVRIAPGAASAEARSELAAALVEELVVDGLIPRAKLRDELQDVHPFSAAAGGGGAGAPPPALRLERAAMIYFGVPSYGVHVNGWVRDPDDPSSSVPWAMWVATRSMSKATYPGLLDQVVAGGQPTAMSFDENVRKECEEEASLPPEVIATIAPAGSVSYRYATAKGLSTKLLMTYDLEMPGGLQPLCSDGEVEEFRLLRMDEVLRSLRDELPLWKPNSALVAIDFCVRHRLVDETEPGYAELVRLLDQKLL